VELLRSDARQNERKCAKTVKEHLTSGMSRREKRQTLCSSSCKGYDAFDCRLDSLVRCLHCVSTRCRMPTKRTRHRASGSKRGCRFGFGLANTHVTQHTPTANGLTTLNEDSSSDWTLATSQILEPL
jgi:hypothetical protein